MRSEVLSRSRAIGIAFYGCEENRWFIERVVAWALVRKKGEVDHVRSIDSG